LVEFEFQVKFWEHSNIEWVDAFPSGLSFDDELSELQ
jgi:hypothetical protein